MSDTSRNILDELEDNGVLQHVVLQAHANLGLEPSSSFIRGPRLLREMERIARDPHELTEAVERFGPEVQRELIARYSQASVSQDAPFDWLHMQEPIPADKKATGKTMADLTRSERKMVQAYAEHTIKTHGRSMGEFEQTCEHMAGDAQSLLAAIAHDKINQMTLKDVGFEQRGR